MKLLSSRRTFCVHHTTMHKFTVSLHSKPNTTIHICSAPHLWQNAIAVTWGWNGYRNKSTENRLWRKNSLAAPVGTRTSNITITCPALYHWALHVSLINLGYCAVTAFCVGDATLYVMDLLSLVGSVPTSTFYVMDLLSFGVSAYLYTLCDGPAVIWGQCLPLHSMLWTCCHLGSLYCYTLCWTCCHLVSLYFYTTCWTCCHLRSVYCYTPCWLCWHLGSLCCYTPCWTCCHLGSVYCYTQC